MMRRVLLFTLSLLVFFSLSVFSVEEMDKFEKMSYKVKPAVVKILAGVIVDIVYLRDNNQIQERFANGGSGSGFIINPDGYIVTNGHVVKITYHYEHDREKVLNELMIQFVVNKLIQEGKQLTPQNAEELVQTWIKEHRPQIVNAQVVKKVFICNGDIYDYEIKKYSPPIPEGGKDIAVTKIEAHDLPVVFLGNSSEVKLQQLVFPFGYPGAVEPGMHEYLGQKTSLEVSITRGTISALKVDYKGVPVIQTDAAITHGNSGGPACDENGMVIGISTFGSIGQDPYTGRPVEVAGFNFLVPIDTAKEFIQDAGVAYNVTSKFNEKYNIALEAVWSKKWLDAKDLINSALIFMPNQPDLIKLRQYVEAKVNEMNWFESMWAKNKIAVIMLFLMIIIAFSVIVIILSMQRKPAMEKAISRREEKEPMKVSPEPALTKIEGDFETRLEEAFGTLKVKVRGVEIGTYTIKEEGLIIGRDPRYAQIVVDEPVVSRVHCMIIPEKEKIALIDRGSANGTFLNGIKVDKAYLKDGDTISLGQKGQVLIIFSK